MADGAYEYQVLSWSSVVGELEQGFAHHQAMQGLNMLAMEGWHPLGGIAVVEHHGWLIFTLLLQRAFVKSK